MTALKGVHEKDEDGAERSHDTKCSVETFKLNKLLIGKVRDVSFSS